MADNNEPSKWRRLPKMSFNSKELAKRMKRVEGATIKHARRFVFKRWDNFREVRRRIALWVLVTGIVIGATGLQFWWYQESYRTTAAAADGTYAEAVLGPVDTLNPIFAKSSAEQSASELLFSRLLTYDSTGHLNYDLADSMKVSDDQKTYTLTIRPDAQWSDGLYVRARDVVFTVGLLQDATTRSTLSGWDGIKVTEVDERTVAFTLPAVYAPFPHALRTLPILPEHILRDVEPAQLRENSFSTAPIGSGPFALKLLQVVDSTNGRKIIHLVRNDDYFKGAAKLSRIQLHVYKDVDAIQQALKTSEVNAASDLTISAAANVNSRYAVDNRMVNSGVYALFNTSSPFLQDQKVRHALQLGTDTAAVRAEISGSLSALDGPIINDLLSGDVPTAPAYNIEQANALLTQAGWVLKGSVREKDGQPLALTVVTTKNPDFEKVLDSLTKQWRELGVTVTTNIVDPDDAAQNVTRDVLQPRQFDVLLYQLTIGGDPDVYAYWHSSQATSAGRNFSNYSSSIADSALTSARSVIDPQLRNAKYLTFIKQWLNDVPAIGLYQATSQYVHTNSVHAVTENSEVSVVDRYNNVLYWTVGDESVFKTP